MRIEKPKAKIPWAIVLLTLLIVVCAVIFVPLFAVKPPVPSPLEITSFEGDVQVYDVQTHAWRVPKRGEEFHMGQKLKTGSDGIANLQVPDRLFFRLKENSELWNQKPSLFDKEKVYKLFLGKGVLFGATQKEFDRKAAEKKEHLQVLTPELLVIVRGAIFRIEASSQHWVGVLRGAVEVKKAGFFSRWSPGSRIRGLERIGVKDHKIQPVQKVSKDEWGEIKEAYELLAKTAVMEAEQIDLSKQAGTLFNFIFDHGTFFTPKIGYAGREFFKDPETGKIILDVEYDVFPKGSFDGVYMKTRNFDAAKYASLSMEIRRNAEEGVPDSFYIEMKSKGNVVRRFSPRGFERNWKPFQFDFHANRETLITEIAFVFTNERVGEAKKGMLQLRDMNLIPLPEPLKTLPKPTSTSQPTATQSSTPSETSTQEVSSKPAETAPVPKEVSL